MVGKGNANCQATSTKFPVWPTEFPKTWTLWKSDVSLVLECNGQVVVVYRIADNGACETNFATPIVGVKVNTGDSATTNFATVSESIFWLQLKLLLKSFIEVSSKFRWSTVYPNGLTLTSVIMEP